MKSSKPLNNLVVLMVLALWIYSFFFVPTFDLDESLYRRVAEEMKWNGNFWHPVWDARAFNHKPPFLYWLIVFFSRIFDGAEAGVSILAARFPNFLATIGILFFIGRSQKKPIKESILLWGLAFFPLITSTTVIFDPLQTLALIPALLIPHRNFSENREFSIKDWIWIALSMFAATAIKGLTGLILPSLAIGLHFLVRSYKSLWKEALKFFGYSFLPAAALSFLFYYFLDQKMGRGFTEEFFLVHHLGRGTQAMEAHHGPIYYYVGIILLGGGLLIPQLVFQGIRTQFNFRTFGFPLSFSIASLVFFSLSATKLPHYTWPIWPALVLQLMTLQSLPTDTGPQITSPAWKIFLTPMALLGFMLFWFAFNPEIIRQTEVDTLEILFISVAATLCFVSIILFKKYIRQIEFISCFTVLIAILISVPLAMIGDRVFVEPFFEAARILKKDNASPKDCIRDSGPMTATLSLALGKELGREYLHNRCEPGEIKYLIAPTSKKAECDERKMSVLHEGKTLTVCKQ